MARLWACTSHSSRHGGSPEHGERLTATDEAEASEMSTARASLEGVSGMRSQSLGYRSTGNMKEHPR